MTWQGSFWSSDVAWYNESKMCLRPEHLDLNLVFTLMVSVNQLNLDGILIVMMHETSGVKDIADKRRHCVQLRFFV